MRRSASFVVLLLVATAARADRMADFTPELRAAIAEMCVIGTVTEIEKEPVSAKPYPTSTDPIPFTVAVVKVETNVHGAKNLTVVRVGFLSPPPGQVRNPQPSLKVNQNVCLFLNKLPGTAVYAMPPLSPPLEVTDATKESVAGLKRLGPVFADPMAALKAATAEDRAFAAAALVTRYRQTRVSLPTVEQAIPAEETKAILAALAAAEWKPTGDAFSPATAVMMLGLTKAAGYNPPRPQPGEDALTLMRTEFRRWVGDEGAKYELQKRVPKAE